jgi:phospholipid/cholesterol/gamma-HCH transport system substrate-binding protein
VNRAHRKRNGRTSAFGAGVLALAAGALVLYLGFTKAIPFRHHFTVSAVFPSANDIRPNAPVRIAGVEVGKVTKIAHGEDGAQAAIVTMRIDRKGVPIHRDATMKIRPRIFLEGNFFVDVQPGSASSPELRDGDRLPINQTSAPVQLDQVLAAFQAPTRRDLQGILKALSAGLDGGGARALNRSIPFWAPAYRDTSIVTDALQGTENHDLSRFIANAGATAAALDRHATALKSLVVDFDTTAAALAARDGQLSAAVAELPRTLGAAEPALRALNAAFPPVRRLIRDARPAVRSTNTTLDAAVPFVRQARGLVSEPELRGLSRDLRPVVPPLTTLEKRTVPLFGQVRAASSCQNEVVLPWSRDTIQDRTFPALGPVYEEATKPLPGLAGESRSGDANGQWFRVMVAAPKFAYPIGTDRFFFTGDPIQGVNPPVPQNHKRSPLRPDVPCETQQPPDLRTIPQGGPSGFPLPAPSLDQLQKPLEDTVAYLRNEIRQQGLDLKVSDAPAKLQELTR